MCMRTVHIIDDPYLPAGPEEAIYMWSGQLEIKMCKFRNLQPLRLLLVASEITFSGRYLMLLDYIVYPKS